MVAVGKTEVPAKYVPVLLAASAKYGVSPAFLAAQIEAESGFNPNAVSPAGAIGISQFMPGTAKSMGIDPRDPVQSINAMAKLMAHYKKQYGSWEQALYAYHDGPGKHDDPGPAGIAYAKKILSKLDPREVGKDIREGAEEVIGAVDPFKNTEKLFAKFTDPAALRRVGLWFIGATLLTIGVFVVFWNYGGGSIVKETAGVKK
jgi:hypothetical protein